MKHVLMMMAIGGWLAGSAVSWAEGPAAPPTTQEVKAKAAAVAAANAAVKTAVEALRKEAANPTRKTSDYFLTNKSDAVTPDAILGALNSLSGSTPREKAYIGWQLLSGLPPKVEDKGQISRLLSIYNSAPAPVAHPGLGIAPPQANAEAARMKQGDIAAFTTTWQKRIADWAAANDAILKYRDELFSHLPISAASVEAAFKDAYRHTEAGVDAETFMGTAMSACRSWAASGAPAGEIAAMQQLVERMAKSLDEKAVPPFPPKCFDGFQADNKTGKVAPTIRPARFVGKPTLVELAKTLQDAQNPNTALHFKPPN